MTVKYEIITQSGTEGQPNFAQQRTWYQGVEDKFKPHHLEEGPDQGTYDGYHKCRNAARRMIGDLRADSARGAKIKLNTDRAPIKYLIEERSTKAPDGQDVPGILWELIVRPVPGQVIEPRVRKPKDKPEAPPQIGENGQPIAPPPAQPRRARRTKPEAPAAPQLASDGVQMPPPPPPPPPPAPTPAVIELPPAPPPPVLEPVG